MTWSLIVINVSFWFGWIANADVCLDWFLKAGLANKAAECELQCRVTPIDMGSFPCPNRCEELCSKSTLDLLLNYAPRLTEGDRVAIAKMPAEAIKVFVAKERADKATEMVFKSSGKNDESDAFRHFLWSFLVAKEIGEEKQGSL